MKVLMFGWEYPPHVFGGLATANYGISEGLKAQGDIETVLCLPHPFGDESQHACRIVAMNAVPIAYRDVDYDYVKQRVGNIMAISWIPTIISSSVSISMPTSTT